MRRKGTVTAIDRTNRVVRAVLDDGTEIEAAFFPSKTPWPLAKAWFEGEHAPSWRCLGPIGDRRVVLHDDFLFVLPATGVLPITVLADGHWIVAGAGGGVGPGPSGTVAQLATEQGTMRTSFTTGGGVALGMAGWLRKDLSAIALPSGPAVMWATFRWKAPAAQDGLSGFSLGFGNGVTGGGIARDAGAYVEVATGTTQWTVSGGASSVSMATSPFAADTWVVLDVMWGDGWVAGWANGDGPWYVENSPAAATSILAFSVRDDIGTAPTFDLDYVHVESIDLAVHPSSVAA